MTGQVKRTTPKPASDGETIAMAIYQNFTSPNVLDANLEPANLVDAVDTVGRGIARELAEVAQAINNLAEAIRAVTVPPAEGDGQE